MTTTAAATTTAAMTTTMMTTTAAATTTAAGTTTGAATTTGAVTTAVAPIFLQEYRVRADQETGTTCQCPCAQDKGVHKPWGILDLRRIFQ